jgi:hypothetical protein
MKKVIFIAIVAVASLASCKKDRTCTCTSGGYSSVTTYTKAKKGDARAACLSYTVTDVGYSYVVTCELK